jgi:hypothetical protein
MLFKADQSKNTIRCRRAQSDKSVAANALAQSESRSASVDKAAQVQRAMMKFIMLPRVSRHGMYLIALVTLLYSTLPVIVAGCAVAHTARSQGHQSHHGEQGSSGLNSLCAWACQATADAVATMGPAPTVREILAGSVDLFPYPFIRSAERSNVPTRAPPVIFFVNLG